jgi:hypothetical protein
MERCIPRCLPATVEFLIMTHSLIFTLAVQLIVSYISVIHATSPTNNYANSPKSIIFKDFTASSNCFFTCACPATSTPPPSSVESGMLNVRTKSTFLASTRQSARRMEISSGDARLNFATFWVPDSVVGVGVGIVAR